jgi:membrane protein DedA with SNARE-associated domain
LRTYGSFLLLRSAYDVGMPQSGSIRAWMSLRYLADNYRVPEPLLIEGLALPADTPSDTTLKSLADREGVSRFSYVRRVQQTIADVVPGNSSPDGQGSGSWLGWLQEQFLSALLVYGYPILGLTLLFGAIGLPLPTGLSAAVAGSLSAVGRMDWLIASAIAVLASILGDVIAYAVGRAASEPFLQRWGRWLGYMSGRQVRAEALFDRWGAPTILLSRTLISHLSSIVSLLAGLHRYRFHAFLTIALLGRLIWTTAYVGLGYTLAGDVDAATDFLKNLTGLLVSVSLLAASTLIAFSRRSGKRRPS